MGGHRSQAPRDVIGLPFLLEVTVASAGWEAVDFLQSPGVGRTTLRGGKEKKKDFSELHWDNFQKRAKVGGKGENIFQMFYT